MMEWSHLELWLAVLSQTLVFLGVGVRYILRIERRLMRIELKLDINGGDK